MNDARTAAVVINALDNTKIDGVTLKIRADTREAEGTSAGFSDRRFAEPTGTTLFVGLGPNGHEVTQDALVRHLAAFGAVVSVTMRGSFAIVEAASVADAVRLCRDARGTMLLSCQLSVREDRGSSRGDVAQSRGPTVPTGTSLFVGLGPRGHDVTQEALAKHLAAFGAIASVSMRGSFAIVEAASVADAAGVCREASGTELQGCRISVREDQGGSRGGSFVSGRGSGGYRGGSFAPGRGFGGPRGGRSY
jgi:hypothetical protein